MKPEIHPDYHEVCFLDINSGHKFITRSCTNTRETIKLDDGRELPLYKLETSSHSHPFYTGQQKTTDNIGGRAEKFRSKFAQFGKPAAAKAGKE